MICSYQKIDTTPDADEADGKNLAIENFFNYISKFLLRRKERKQIFCEQAPEGASSYNGSPGLPVSEPVFDRK
jgi:hypothetical protein